MALPSAYQTDRGQSLNRIGDGNGDGDVNDLATAKTTATATVIETAFDHGD